MQAEGAQKTKSALDSLLADRFERLSPLDALKARGKLLHRQLKSDETQTYTPNSRRAREQSNYDDSPFLSEQGYTARPHDSDRASILTTASEFSDVSTIRSQSELGFRSDHAEDWTTSKRKPTHAHTLYTPAEVLRTPDLDSIRSSPTNSVHSASSSIWSHTGRSQQSGYYPTSPMAPEDSFATPSPRHLPSTPQLPSSNYVRTVEYPPFQEMVGRYAGSQSSPRSPRSNERPRANTARALSYRIDPSPSSLQSSPRSTGAIRPPLQTAGSSRRATMPAKTSKSPQSAASQLASLPDHSLGAAEHIDVGIEQHEKNQLPQSTHHFKVAADLGDPTGCMLYGLALRHGWGCRADLPRSLHFLRLAADSATLNINDIRQSKALKVPLEDIAIAVYELGVSYQNGWGVVVDKKSSLKYFDLAASWGDVEAMAAAADCYLVGRGCSKDKKKAATYLRTAEEKGRKEVGNAWIWKEKYNPSG